MKHLKHLTVLVVALSILAGPVSGLAEEKKPKAKPYILKTCIVSGDKLGEMGDPYLYVYAGREIKFCCKGCLKDFNKEPAKFVKKIEEAEKKLKATNKNAAPSTTSQEHPAT
jgi:YHS domain-containing protein